jgi:catechol 2,3-dioxygenase-like lactoylglutathione lyase family enzyme
VQRVAKKTGSEGFGIMIHTVHMVDDVPAANRWYEDVFGGLLFMAVDEPNYLPVEKRYASLLMVSDLCVEPMAPAHPVDLTTPVGRFFDKYGSHLHSIGYKVDDLAGLGSRLIDEGVAVCPPGGGVLTEIPDDLIYFYPHPKQSGGVMVECCATDMPNDPRLADSWSSLQKLWNAHPLGIQRVSHITFGVDDLEGPSEKLRREWEAVPVHEGVDDALAAKARWYQLGDALVELASPLEPSTRLGEHVARWGDMIYGITFRVADLDRAEAHLHAHGVSTTRPQPDVVNAAAEDCFGAAYAFTTREVPGDPFA